MANRLPRLAQIGGLYLTVVVTLSVAFAPQFLALFNLTVNQFAYLFVGSLGLATIAAIWIWLASVEPNLSVERPLYVERPPVVQLEDTEDDNVSMIRAPRDRTAVRDIRGKRTKISDVEEVERREKIRDETNNGEDKSERASQAGTKSKEA